MSSGSGARAADLGIVGLEAALGLVRGRPHGDNPPAWAATRVQEMRGRRLELEPAPPYPAR
ncbi:hypothetical protein ABZ990_03070 [Streptomyces sp. NPDC046203]|uniref:hypothetical protein n=1 Tax=Streptomyces sp. NPDC046203 TaxID=3154602 RepID=UPI0033F95F15